MPIAWPTGAPVRIGSPPVAPIVETWCSSATRRAVRVDDALGGRGRARRVADHRGRVGVDRRRPGERRRSNRSAKATASAGTRSVADDRDGLEVGEARAGARSSAAR